MPSQHTWYFSGKLSYTHSLKDSLVSEDLFLEDFSTLSTISGAQSPHLLLCYFIFSYLRCWETVLEHAKQMYPLFLSASVHEHVVRVIYNVGLT